VLGGGAWRYWVDDRIGCCGRPRDNVGCEREVIGIGRERWVCVVFRESPLPRCWCIVVGFTELLSGLGDSDWVDELRDRDAGI
jgi:hypothetical protein